MNISIVLYEGLTVLDAIGPYEVFNSIPDINIHFVGEEKGLVRSDNNALALNADYTFSEISDTDIVIVPGTPHFDKVMNDDALKEWLCNIHPKTKWTTSVCTGALALGAAGLLKDKKATTHWMAMDILEKFGAEKTKQRVVKDGKIITAAGVSSGIDMALSLLKIELGDDVAQTAQLIIEYDPQPPFNAGSPDKAPTHITENLRAMFANQ